MNYCNKNKNCNCTWKVSMNFLNINKALQNAGGFLKACEECYLDLKVKGVKINTDNRSMLLCLKCGIQECSIHMKSHFFQHNPSGGVTFGNHSKDYGICVNTTSWNLWCQTCTCYFKITDNKELLEFIEYLKNYNYLL